MTSFVQDRADHTAEVLDALDIKGTTTEAQPVRTVTVQVEDTTPPVRAVTVQVETDVAPRATDLRPGTGRVKTHALG